MQIQIKNTNLFFILIMTSLISCKNNKLSVANYESYIEVKAKESNTSEWVTYKAKTVDNLKGFTSSEDPSTSKFGGWKTEQFASTGFFRTEKIENRWWIIDPEGYPFIHRGVAVVRPGSTAVNQTALSTKFSSSSKWIERETDFLKSYGFNGAGAWSNTELIKKSSDPLIYSVIIQPMRAYRNEDFKLNEEKYIQAGSTVYRYDLIMVFNPEFDQYIESIISPIAMYANDKNLLGYYTDNELPWVDDALDRHLNFLEVDDPGYVVTKRWLEDRKGVGASASDITQSDRDDFLSFYFETYMEKVTTAIKKYDPNHMYLGCRFNIPSQELSSPEIFEAAGRYMDIISINHYFKWQPDQKQLRKWESWSNKPILITEWYTKGEDTGMENYWGAGWIVPTQEDRGYFYQNFTLDLLESKVCVGWHWFRYQDEGTSNKGLVDHNYKPYTPVFESIKKINDNTYQLIKFFDK